LSEALLSVVLPADRYATIRPVVDRLQRQTARGQIEIVLAMPSAETCGVAPADLEMFASVRIAAVTAPRSTAVYRAAGADLIFIGETYSYSHPGWAEALIRAGDPSRDVIVPAFGNANPDGAASWAGFLSDYGYWIDGQVAGQMGAAPLFNVAYRRSFLLRFGDRLETVLSHSDELAVSLQKCGCRIHFEPSARIDHLNLSVMTAFLGERFYGGRLIGASRGARWSWFRRLAYACGSPLIPPVLLWRTAKGVRLAARLGRRPGEAGRALLSPANCLRGQFCLPSVAGGLLGAARRAHGSWSDRLQVRLSPRHQAASGGRHLRRADGIRLPAGRMRKPAPLAPGSAAVCSHTLRRRDRRKSSDVMLVSVPRFFSKQETWRATTVMHSTGCGRRIPRCSYAPLAQCSQVMHPEPWAFDFRDNAAVEDQEMIIVLLMDRSRGGARRRTLGLVPQLQVAQDLLNDRGVADQTDDRKRSEAARTDEGIRFVHSPPLAAIPVPARRADSSPLSLLRSE
jgi:hypothetical protein